MVVALTVSILSAAPLTVALRHSATGQCPDQGWLEGNVTARLGYSPFAADGVLQVKTRLECSAAACQGLLEVLGSDGGPRRWALSAQPGQCRELAESLGLALALVVDPQLLSRPAEVKPPPPQPPRTEAQPQPVAPSPPLFFQAMLTGHGSVGLSPYPTGGAGLDLGVRWRALGLLVEGRIDGPRSVAVASGQVESQVLLASLLPCAYLEGFGVCLQLGAGALQVSGELPGGARRTTPLVLVGARLLYEWMFLSWLGLHVHVGVAGVATRITVVAAGAPVWVTSPVAADAAVGPVVRF